MPIVVLEKCEQCGNEFFVTTQDSKVLEVKGSTILCPPCRREDIRRMKREAMRKKRQEQNK